MNTFFNLSGSASLALHALSLMAAYPDRLVSTKELSSALDSSKDHLHKVLQRLVKNGIVNSTRGPNGGFQMQKPFEEIILLDVIKAIDGPPNLNPCLMVTPVCSRKGCVFGTIIHNINKQVFDYLSGTTLSQIADVFDETHLNHHEKCT